MRPTLSSSIGGLLSLAVLASALPSTSYLSGADKTRLKAVFEESLAKDSLTDVSYAILGLKLLGEQPPKATTDLCQKLQAAVQRPDVNVFVTAHQVSAAAKALGSCAIKFSDAVGKELDAAISPDAPMSDLYHAVMALSSRGAKVDSAKILDLVTGHLKKDLSIATLGYAFGLAAELEGAKGTAVSQIFDRVEDAVSQADEVDGTVLQFEGGLAATGMIVSGAYRLADKVGKAPAITKAQAVKFANFFLARRNAQQSKGGFYVLSSLSVLSNNKHHVPVAVTLASPIAVSASSPKVVVKVSDVLGNSIGKTKGVVQSVMHREDGEELLSDVPMTIGKDETLHEFDLHKANPRRGFYEVTINVDCEKADSRFIGMGGAVLVVKAMTNVKVSDAEFSIAEVDQTTKPKGFSVSYPERLTGKLLEADQHNKLEFKFSLTDGQSNEPLVVHQAFVMLKHKDSGAEIIFVAETQPEGEAVYHFDLPVYENRKEFGEMSGTYEMHLMVGDAVVSNPIFWNFGSVQLQFSDSRQQSAAVPRESGAAFEPKPIINHLFRVPEKRAPLLLSNLFTFFCILPFFLMILIWIKLGVNISAFPFSLSAVGFHGGVGAIFCLYFFFWLRLDMFTTVKCLAMVGVVTFLCGSSMLSQVAERRKKGQ